MANKEESIQLLVYLLRALGVLHLSTDTLRNRFVGLRLVLSLAASVITSRVHEGGGLGEFVKSI